ncbi:MAG: NAD-glutamate dehydrogenase domain-containing protein, partial [Alphaproteobacteria bacterium]
MTPQKTILLKTVIEACHERTRDNTARACFPLFVEEFFRHASLTYLQRRAPEVLAEQALEAWNCLQKRPPKEQVFITMSTASDEGGYYLTIIQDEKVFLYDTVKLFLESREVRPSLFAHPVWCVVRTPKGLLQEIHHKQIPNGCWESLMFAYIKDSPNKALIDDLQQVLASVHTVVDGYAAMQGKLDSVIEYLMPSPEAQGTVTYLKWLQQDNFVFLGYRYFAVDNKTTTSALGLLAQEPYIQESKLMPSLTSTTPPLFNYVKTNYRSPVHCPSRINSLEIIHQKADGTIVGLHQFIGLYTRASFAHSVFSIPIIKEKVQEVFDNFNVLPKGYDGKLLARILESIPQDELLNASPHDIHEMAAAILQLKDGGLLALFVRPDPFSAFVSIIIYMPLERYSAATKERFAKLLPQVLGGEITSSKVLISDLPFARIIFVISYETPQKITYDLPLLEQELGQASLSWVDSFLQEINVQFTEAAAGAFARTYGEAFDTDYQEKFSVPEALFDLPYLEELTSENPINIRIYTSNLTQKIKVKIYHYAESLPLADMLPVLNNLELQPASETSFHVHPKDKQDLWIHDFDLKDQHDDWSPKIIHLIVDAFHHIWHGNSENDDLNRLVPLCSLNCSQVMILRGYLYYLRQIKFPYSFDYCQETLITYPHITREIINLFWIKFAPSDIAWQDRQQQRKIQEAKIIDLLQSVTSLDHDRILQRFLIMIQVTLRTNYFQGTPESHDFARTTSSFIGAHV